MLGLRAAGSSWLWLLNWARVCSGSYTEKDEKGTKFKKTKTDEPRSGRLRQLTNDVVLISGMMLLLFNGLPTRLIRY